MDLSGNISRPRLGKLVRRRCSTGHRTGFVKKDPHVKTTCRGTKEIRTQVRLRDGAHDQGEAVTWRTVHKSFGPAELCCFSSEPQ